MPHLVIDEEEFRISQKAVDEFVKCSEYQSGWSLRAPYSADHPWPPDFKLPFVTSDPPISDPLRLFGKDYDPNLPDDPLDQLNYPQTLQLVNDQPSNPYEFGDLDDLQPSISARPKIQIGPYSALAQVAFQPRLRAKVVEVVVVVEEEEEEDMIWEVEVAADMKWIWVDMMMEEIWVEDMEGEIV